MDTAKPAAPVTVPFHSKDTGENEKNSRNRKKRRKTRGKTERGQQKKNGKKQTLLTLNLCEFTYLPKGQCPCVREGSLGGKIAQLPVCLTDMLGNSAD